MSALIALLMAASVGAARADAEEWSVQVGRGAQTLQGSLLRADQSGPRAAVLLIGGSGPEDRNGDDLKDGQKSHTLQLLALGLAEHGVSSLRFDKGGVGESAPAGTAASVGALVDEAVDWARFLRRQPGVRCVVLLGHSEGALIATLSAERIKTCGLVLVSGSSRNLGDLIEDQGPLTHRTPEQQAKVHEVVQSLRAGRPVPDAPAKLSSAFAPDAQAYTMSEINLDPVAELARVKVPVLVVQGDNDLQVKVDDAKRLAAASGGEPVIIAGMNHVLKLAPTTMVGNFMTYLNPNLPLAPGVASGVADFVQARR